MTVANATTETRGYSFSSLTIPCERALWKKSRGHKAEIFKSDEAEEGSKIHNLYAEAIKTGNWETVIDYTGVDPTNLKKILADGKDIEVEKHFTYNIRDKKYVGVIDVKLEKEDTIILIDHKTSGSTIIRDDYKRQLRWYALTFLDKGLPIKSYVHFTRFNNVRLVETILPFDREKIETDLMDKIATFDVISNLKAEPPPNQCWYCSFCPYIRSCPSIQLDEKDPEQIGKEIIKLEQKLKALKKLMRAFTQDETLIVEGKEFGYFPIEEVVIDKHEFFQKILDRGGNPFEFITIPKKNAYKAVKLYGEDLTSLIEVKYSTRWGIKTAKKEDV